ncbi:class I SAM-dependent methyltransferase [Hyphomicrobium sp. NDB2Meth4]|uniref:class I SAM-dependent methyltransferase n=1 Tax=Hyphomicrobium sp. NDB2Meth4 TaxID=1892846 RepID=UPI000A5ABF83
MAHTDASAAEHMDAIYRYQRYIYDLTRKYYLLGRDRLVGELAPPDGGSVLEVACGTGRNLITAARRYRQAQFYGFDISSAMLDTARGSIERAGLGGRIQIAHGDATAFEANKMFGVATFDRVFISYALSMIPPWRGALQQALAALAPGGQLFIVDFGNQARLPRWFKRALRRWLAQFSVTPRDDLSTELEKIAAMPGYKVKRMALYRGYAVYAVVTRTS